MNGRKLRVILNMDDSARLARSPGRDITAQWHRDDLLQELIVTRPGVYAQCVGFPDPVIYRSKVATTMDKYIEIYTKDPRGPAMRRLLELGTDPLELVVEVCRQRGVPIVASYRMNAEDMGEKQLDLFDFGRAHKDWAIPGGNCLDPAIPQVYEHRMAIFTEVANEYDIDGIEFDFRRWCHMISDPHENHHVLTKMVRQTRKMLDEAARKKGRGRLLLGARVGPSLDTPPQEAQYPGMSKDYTNSSCKDLGLDVETWIKEQLVDYVCPTLFWPKWPGLPRTADFADLARGTNVGIYPTVWPLPAWFDGNNGPPIKPDDRQDRLRYRNELGSLALTCFDDGADGISAYNWVQHHQARMVNTPHRLEWGEGMKQEQMDIFARFGSARELREYLASGEH